MISYASTKSQRLSRPSFGSCSTLTIHLSLLTLKKIYKVSWIFSLEYTLLLILPWVWRRRRSISSPGKTYAEPIIFNVILLVDSFVHVSSILSKYTWFWNELKDRKGLLGLWKARKPCLVRYITIKTKFSVYEAYVLFVLLYSSETWIAYSYHIKTLERFHRTCLRRILNMKWQSLTADIIVLQQANKFSFEMLLIYNQLRKVRHIGWRNLSYQRSCFMDIGNTIDVQDINLRNILRVSKTIQGHWVSTFETESK